MEMNCLVTMYSKMVLLFNISIHIQDNKLSSQIFLILLDIIVFFDKKKPTKKVQSKNSSSKEVKKSYRISQRHLARFLKEMELVNI